MAFNLYSPIETRVGKACNTIHDGWYANFTQAVSAYDIPICCL